MKTQFKAMTESTAEDWQVILGEQRQFQAGLPDRILEHLSLLGGDFGGFPVDRLQHCLQTAELAAEAGEDDEYVVCALLHDIGDTLGPFNHADVGAAILEPFVSEANHWMVKHHGIFQGYNFFHHFGMIETCAITSRIPSTTNEPRVLLRNTIIRRLITASQNCHWNCLRHWCIGLWLSRNRAFTRP